MKNKKIMFWAIMLLVIAAVITIFHKPTKLGLDLVGGSRLILEAQTTETIAKITPEMMDSLQYAIENRVNALGVSETTVQQIGEKRLMIEIPSIKDPAKAKEFLGETAELEFKKEAQGFNGTRNSHNIVHKFYLIISGTGNMLHKGAKANH